MDHRCPAHPFQPLNLNSWPFWSANLPLQTLMKPDGPPFHLRETLASVTGATISSSAAPMTSHRTDCRPPAIPEVRIHSLSGSPVVRRRQTGAGEAV